MGNANARKHGLYSIEATSMRRELAQLLRSMRTLAEEETGNK
jgi:hypothetical protein